jgi:membrane protein YqaA with SNARE-associated domain
MELLLPIESLFSELVTLFISAFVSATLFPGGSEILLIYFVKNNTEDWLFYFWAATVGNSSGAIFTYLMGYYFYWGREKAKHKRSYHFFKKYGVYTLLLSWLPVIGDLLPLVAGWMKLPILKSLLFIITGKVLRYGLILIPLLYFIK